MRTADEYLLMARHTVGVAETGTVPDFSWRNIAEARLRRKQITQMQKELRLVKKDLGLTIKAIRADYNAARAKIGTGVGAGVAWGLMKGHRRVLGQIHRMERLDLRRRLDAVLNPYLIVSRTIDEVLVQLDATKVLIDRVMLESTQGTFVHVEHSSEPPAPPPVSWPLLNAPDGDSR